MQKTHNTLRAIYRLYDIKQYKKSKLQNKHLQITQCIWWLFWLKTMVWKVRWMLNICVLKFGGKCSFLLTSWHYFNSRLTVGIFAGLQRCKTWDILVKLFYTYFLHTSTCTTTGVLFCYWIHSTVHSNTNWLICPVCASHDSSVRIHFLFTPALEWLV